LGQSLEKEVANGTGGREIFPRSLDNHSCGIPDFIGQVRKRAAVLPDYRRSKIDAWSF
jgi:hypothetical protein